MRLASVTLLISILWIGQAIAQPFAYITVSAEDMVSVIDTSTNMVVATVPGVLRPGGYAGRDVCLCD
ncbi:MAG: hypothetical protein WD000_06340 [Thermodesulfobacteriota bacterium]